MNTIYRNYLALMKMFTVNRTDSFNVKNNNLQLMELIIVNNNNLPLIKPFTVNRIIYR